MTEVHTGGLQLQDALIFFFAAGILVPLLRQLRVNAVLGFLMLGATLGPYGLGAAVAHLPWLEPLVIQDVAGAQALAELGVVMLLFLIGLELSWERLVQMRRWIFGLGSAQLLLCGGAIGLAAWAFGNSPAASLVLGGCLALSSTAIVMQLLNEQRSLGSPLGHASFSILLLQDLAVVPLLLLVGLLGQQGGGDIGAALGAALLKAAAAIALIVLLGRLMLRPLFRWAANSQRSESFMALTLLVAIGTAALTAAAGLSPALGAFLAGLLLAETQYRHEIEVNLEPFNGLLMGLFFMSVGMGIDIQALWRDPLWVGLSVLGLMAIKSTAIAALLRWQRFGWGSSLRGGLLLSQAGEFGFIVVGMASALGLLPADVAQFMLLVVGFSMLLSPLANALGRQLEQRLEHREDGPPGEPPPLPEAQHVLIAGCGRVGQLVARVLDAERQPWVAIERSADLVEQLRLEGFPVVFGDVTRAELMRRLHADRASAVVITVDQPEACEQAVSAIRAHFPHTPIYARARNAEHARRLIDAGASEIVQEAVEAALQLAGLTLQAIGLHEDALEQRLALQREQSRLSAGR